MRNQKENASLDYLLLFTNIQFFPEKSDRDDQTVNILREYAQKTPFSMNYEKNIVHMLVLLNKLQGKQLLFLHAYFSVV